jgi:hypothetical protein
MDMKMKLLLTPGSLFFRIRPAMQLRLSGGLGLIQ